MRVSGTHTAALSMRAVATRMTLNSALQSTRTPRKDEPRALPHEKACLRAVILVRVNARPLLLRLLLEGSAILQLDWHGLGSRWTSSCNLLHERPAGWRARLLALVAVVCWQALATAIITLPSQQASKEAHPVPQRDSSVTLSLRCPKQQGPLQPRASGNLYFAWRCTRGATAAIPNS
jgi:hypothetical protein